MTACRRECTVLPTVRIVSAKLANLGRGVTHHYLLLTAFATLGAMVWRATCSYPTTMLDLFPLYYGGRAWLETGSAYRLDTVLPAMERLPTNYQLLIDVGNVYPLPAVLLLLPLALLPPTVAATIWVGGLVAGLLLALRAGGGWWYALSFPVLIALHHEQYTVLIVIGQIVALWAFRNRHPWLLAWCLALVLTKPQVSMLFVLAMIVLARVWRPVLLTVAAVWGGSFILDPGWPFAWLEMLRHHHVVTGQPVMWELAIGALPLLLMRDRISASLIAQYALMPFPAPTVYPLMTAPLGVLHLRWAWLLVPCSYLFLVGYAYLGQSWSVVLANILPVIMLARWNQSGERAIVA
jgi:glycosyl transferase family 87